VEKGGKPPEIIEKYQKENEMAKNQNNRIRPAQLQADLDALTALRSFSDYAPANPAYAMQKLESSLTGLKSAQDAELAAQNTLASARDAASAAEWDLHNMLLGAKDQVIAQYGSDSDQVQSLGLKKKSEYKAPKLRSKPRRSLAPPCPPQIRAPLLPPPNSLNLGEVSAVRTEGVINP